MPHPWQSCKECATLTEELRFIRSGNESASLANQQHLHTLSWHCLMLTSCSGQASLCLATQVQRLASTAARLWDVAASPPHFASLQSMHCM